MSDAPAQFPYDKVYSPGPAAWRNSFSTLGNMPDPARFVPLGPGQEQYLEQVVIAQPPALSEEQIQSLLTNHFKEAKIYDDRLQIARAEALRTYNGEPMGDEEPGRSQIVLTEVKDTINAMMPTMMRTFAGADRPVEFLPRADGDDEQAAQAQDYVQHVCFVENDGWRALHDSILDCFQLKAGWIHWWWDYAFDAKTEHYYGLLEGQAAALLSEPGVTALRVVRRSATPEERAGIMASPEARITPIRADTPLLVYDAAITRKSPRNRPRLEALLPETVLIDTDAYGPQDPTLRFIGIWRIVTVSDLVALGFPRDLVETRVTQLQQQTNRVTRRRDRLAAVVPRPLSFDPALRRVRFLECWMRFDFDGDGIVELHHVYAIGDYSFLLLGHEPASHVPLARVCAYQVPHRAIGEAVADRLTDVQRAMTRVFRNILDSMAEAIHPRTVIEEGMVPIDDVLNTEMGAVIRERKPGAVRELVKPFVGPQAMPIVEMLFATKESRTGITRTSQGLTPDVLQSTTAMAVGAQIAASADRLEFVVRTIAQGVRDLYIGMLSLLCEHQDRPRTVLLRGRWVPVDPRAWMAGFNVAVKVGVGHGSLMERIQTLGAIAAQQKEAITTMGPNNPLCTLGQLRNTLADIANAAGITNTARYFNPLPTNYQYQPPPQPPSPDQVIANAQAQKVQADAATDQQKTQTDRLQSLLEDERLRDEARAKYVLEALDIAGKYGMHIDLNSINQLMERNPASPAAAALAAPPQPPPVPAAGPPAPGGAPAGASRMPPGPPAGPQGAGSAPPGGSALAQRLFLPPNLIAALAQGNRAPSAAPPMQPAPAPAPIGARPGAMPGFG